MTPNDLSLIHPTGDLVLVHLDPGLQITPAGLIIPPSAQQITQTGLVLAVGPDVPVTDIPVGSTVLIDLHCGTHVCWQANTPVLLVPLPNIQAVLT